MPYSYTRRFTRAPPNHRRNSRIHSGTRTRTISARPRQFVSSAARTRPVISRGRTTRRLTRTNAPRR